MTEHLQLIDKKLEHLERMRGYLTYSLEQVSGLMPINAQPTSASKTMLKLQQARAQILSVDPLEDLIEALLDFSTDADLETWLAAHPKPTPQPNA